jgi:hypothetical protein
MPCNFLHPRAAILPFVRLDANEQRSGIDRREPLIQGNRSAGMQS